MVVSQSVTVNPYKGPRICICNISCKGFATSTCIKCLVGFWWWYVSKFDHIWPVPLGNGCGCLHYNLSLRHIALFLTRQIISELNLQYFTLPPEHVVMLYRSVSWKAFWYFIGHCETAFCKWRFVLLFVSLVLLRFLSFNLLAVIDECWQGFPDRKML